jgi:hypothetical protein
MDRTDLQERLLRADADVARMRTLVLRQRHLIATLEHRGEAVEEAKALLRDYEAMLEIHKSDREWARTALGRQQ